MGAELIQHLETAARRAKGAARLAALTPAPAFAPTPARPVQLDPQMSARDGFRAIACNCLEQLLANYPLVVATGDAEGLHQARVAIRRLRAACTVFRKVTDDRQAAVLRAEWKAAAHRLGPARDLQVLCDLVAADLAAGDQDCRDLLAHLSLRRDAAVRDAQEMLAGPAFQGLLIEFASWLEEGDWLAPSPTGHADEPMAAFARHAVSHGLEKVLREGKQLAKMSDSERHRLRIKVKKLRYAVGFFASLQSEGEGAAGQKALAQALGRLQDSLGELNDMAMAQRDAEAGFADLDPISRARFAAQLQNVLEGKAHSRRRLMKAAQQALHMVARHARDRGAS